MVALTDGLVALHSTDPVTVYLSAAARMRTPRLAALDARALHRAHLVRHHAMRRTLWVFGHDTARAAHLAATLDAAPGAAAAGARHARRGRASRDPERWLAAAGAEIVELLAADGPADRPRGGRPAARPGGAGAGGQREVRHHPGRALPGAAAARASRAGWCGPGRPAPGSTASTAGRPAASWFPGGFDGPDRDPRGAAAELARRWLWTFGPGTRTDLQWWAGWTVATTKRALADVGAVEVELDEGPGYVLPDDVDEVQPHPDRRPLLLPGLDPSTMGWKQRGFHLDPAHVPLLFDRNGNGGPTAWVDGRIVGGWTQRRDGEIVLRIMADVGAEARAALQQQAARACRRCSATCASRSASRPPCRPSWPVVTA